MLPIEQLFSRSTGILCLLLGLAYLVAGLCYLLDPTSTLAPNSDAYWLALAQAHPARQGFLIAFALVGILGFCILPSVRQLVAPDSSMIYHVTWLGQSGFLVTAISYFRVLEGEVARSITWLTGGEAVRKSITSFSISLDTGGWLIFAAIGIYLLAINLAGFWKKTLPLSITVFGLGGSISYIIAFIGIQIDNSKLVTLAAGIGGVGFGPLWWFGVAWLFWQRTLCYGAIDKNLPIT